MDNQQLIEALQYYSEKDDSLAHTKNGLKRGAGIGAGIGAISGALSHGAMSKRAAQLGLKGGKKALTMIGAHGLNLARHAAVGAGIGAGIGAIKDSNRTARKKARSIQ